MSSLERRAAARRRAWGRGPIILRFEPMEGRSLLSAGPLPDLVGGAFDTAHNLDWGGSFQATGQVLNQGKAPAPNAFNVGIYASGSPIIGRGAVLLGEATIPAGLQPGASAGYSLPLALPTSPLPGVDAAGHVYIDVRVDPEGAVAERNKRNNERVGPGYDISVITITPQAPANLIGTSFGVSSPQAGWGDTISLTAQVKNNAQGDAPATRARVVLTPAGVAPGGASDVTVASVPIPALPAWQTANVQQNVTLPALPPSVLAPYSNFTLSMVLDADYQTNALYPHVASQGLGRDSAQLAIPMPANAGVAPPPRPDLAVGAVQMPSAPLAWGSSVQVGAQVQNLGQAPVGPFRVQFLLVGANGDLGLALFLGESSADGLAPGGGETVTQTLTLPSRLPRGLPLASAGVGHIAVVADPENTLDEPLKNNNTAESSPVVLRLLGTDGTSTVPTTPAIGATAAPSPGAHHPGARPRRAHPGKLHRHVGAKPSNTVGHELKVFPKRVSNFFTDLWNKKL